MPTSDYDSPYRLIYGMCTAPVPPTPEEENNDNKGFWQLEDSTLLPGPSKALGPVQLEELGGQRKS
jgi:hypothetical protein